MKSYYFLLSLLFYLLLILNICSMQPGHFQGHTFDIVSAFQVQTCGATCAMPPPPPSPPPSALP